MRRPTLIALLLCCGLATARADEAPSCLPLADVGCLLERPGATAVLVYHRGYLTRPLPGERFIRGGGAIPRQLLAASAVQAVDQYDLTTAAAALNASLIVTGAYDVGVDASSLAQGRRVLIAAHSGGVVGLAQTLGLSGSFDGIALLDCFYGEDSGTLVSLGDRVAELLRGSPSAACGGFYTPHNDRRLHKIFLPRLGDQASRCRFDARDADEHNTAVAQELVSALRSSLPVQDGSLIPRTVAHGSFDARWDGEVQSLFKEGEPDR